MKRSPSTLIVAGLAAFSFVAAACGSDDAEPQSSDAAPADTDTLPTGSSADSGEGDAMSESITIYSGRNEELVQPILDRFEAETGIDVDVKYDDAANLALLIDEEASAGRVEADVFLSQSPGTMGFLDTNGRLAQLPETTLDLVDVNVRDADGRWIGITGRQRVLVYNTDLVDPADLPTSVFDLIDERWQGQIGVAGGNGSFQDFVTSMRATQGEDMTAEWLSDLAALDPVPYPKNSAIVAAVGRGEVEVGLVNHYYNFLALEEDPNQTSANHVFEGDDPGAVLLVTAAAIVDGSERTAEAALLIDFLLSDDSQRSFSDDEYEYPLASGVEPSGGLPALDFTDVGSIDFNELQGGLEATRELIADAGLES